MTSPGGLNTLGETGYKQRKQVRQKLSKERGKTPQISQHLQVFP